MKSHPRSRKRYEGNCPTNMFDWFKKEEYVRGVNLSKFDIWFAEHFWCKYFGHKWEYWSLIGRYKCERCLEARPQEETAHGHLTYFQKLKMRSLRPDGSVATGVEGQRIRDLRLRSQEQAAKRTRYLTR